MKLSELFLNRFLYREKQSIETQDSSYVGGNVSDADASSVASGSAAFDINTGAQLLNGGSLLPGSIPQAVLDISNLGWTNTCAFTVTDLDTVSWGIGTFTSASGTAYSIGADNTGNMSAKTYVYLDVGVSTSAYQKTTNVNTALGLGKVLIAVCENGTATATFVPVQTTQIVGDNIAANSINASKITTGQLIVGTNVGLGTAQDSSGVTTIIGNTVTTGFINALSVTAGHIAAENITAGTITGFTIVGSTLSTATSGQRVVLTTTLAQYFNSSGVEIVDTYASSNSFLIKGQQSTSAIFLDAGSNSNVVFGRGGAEGVAWNGADLFPWASDTYNLGNISKKWNDLWLTGTIIYQGFDQPVTYYGDVDSAGNAGNTFPAGWSVSKTGTGLYTVTHSFGHSNYAVQATAFDSIARVITVYQRNDNDFRVRIATNGTATVDPALLDCAFFFCVHENP